MHHEEKGFSKRRELFADYYALARVTSEVAHSRDDVPEELQRNPGVGH